MPVHVAVTPSNMLDLEQDSAAALEGAWVVSKGKGRRHQPSMCYGTPCLRMSHAVRSPRWAGAMIAWPRCRASERLARGSCEPGSHGFGTGRLVPARIAVTVLGCAGMSRAVNKG